MVSCCQAAQDADHQADPCRPSGPHIGCCIPNHRKTVSRNSESSGDVEQPIRRRLGRKIGVVSRHDRIDRLINPK